MYFVLIFIKKHTINGDNMKEKDLSIYDIRTDLIVDLIQESPSFEKKRVIEDTIKRESILLSNNES